MGQLNNTALGPLKITVKVMARPLQMALRLIMKVNVAVRSPPFVKHSRSLFVLYRVNRISRTQATRTYVETGDMLKTMQNARGRPRSTMP